ncbi:hypothetical protein BV22DRAFT_1108505 [Leucogyrophana mollusca]|uniref:Uncharacterized protein n=1 Tax=Leucogyrophana mollusca TaxID=85980 RepID=A0ACB8AX94_9AGAM|nr:hypothetical protein BV22DRAFT_1108505 [Leucogyrophana mollusca]
MSEGNVDIICDLWAATLAKHNDKPPFADHADLLNVIDSTPLGGVKWQGFSVEYNGERPPENVPPWMNGTYEVWFRDPRLVVHNILASPDFASEIDYAPYREYRSSDNKRQWRDFFSGDWVWQQADAITKDPATHGAAFVPVILGSDKTTVSVGTGHNEYYPLYASIGNVHNNVRRAHRDALVIIGFLAIPKTNRQYNACENFRTFRRQLFHASITHILQPLKPAMTVPEVVRFGDSHFRRVVYGLGPYIADYEEQVVLATIIRNWCPKCLSLRTDLDSAALLRTREHTDVLIGELNPGTLWDEYGIIDDVVPFTNDFPRADIHQLLSPDILHQLIKGVFKDHLVDWVERYLKITHGTARASEIMADIDRRIAAVASFSNLQRFPEGRGFKQWTGDDSKALMKVYLPAIEGHVPPDAIRTFRAFLDFCYLTNQRLDKLAASRVDFEMRGMLRGSVLSDLFNVIERKRARTVAALADEISVPHLRRLIRHFLFSQLHPEDERDPADVPAAACPRHEGKINVYNSATATFYAPSDPSGVGGMRREHICACPIWQNEHARYDCVFVSFDSSSEGMRGLEIARILTFFSFVFEGGTYPCAVVHWFEKTDADADEDTGMWIVRPGFHEDQSRHLAVIHIDTIYRAAHLIPVYGAEFVPDDLKFYHSYDTFRTFYVNKYVDHHAFEIAF